jgi:hypothetical protein
MEGDPRSRWDPKCKMNIDKCYSDILNIGLNPFWNVSREHSPAALLVFNQTPIR